jgi:hypothetical protein
MAAAPAPSPNCSRALQQPAHHRLARPAGLGLLAEDVGVDAHPRRARGEHRVGGEELLDRAHQGRLAGPRRADHENVAHSEAGELLGQGDRHLLHRAGLADDALAEGGGDLVRRRSLQYGAHGAILMVSCFGGAGPVG